MSMDSKLDPMDSETEISNLNHQQRLRHRVEVQSMHIEKLLAKNQIKAEVNGGSIRRGWIDFDIQAQFADGWQKFRHLRDELVSALNVPDVKINRQNGSLRLFVKKDAPHEVDLLELNDINLGLSGVGVSLGVSEDGQPILLNLSAPDINNLLITGVEGAGKSALMRTLAISLSLSNRQSEVQLGVITTGNESQSFVARPNTLYPLNYLPHLLFPVATTVEDGIQALEFLSEEIKYRLDNNLRTPLLVLLIDDVDWLLSQGGQAVYRPLSELLEVTTDAGLRMVISATDVNEGGLSRLLKHNASLRFVGRVGNADQAFYLTGELDTGAEYLNGRGDFLAVSYGNQIRFQAAYIDDYDLHMTLSNLHRPKQGVLLARRRKDGIYGKTDENESTVNFSYDSVNGRATINESIEDDTNNEQAVILENSNPLRSFDDDVSNQSTLSPRSRSLSFVDYELPIFHDHADSTSDELPGFLSDKQEEQIAIYEDNDEDQSSERQSELEYSDLIEDIDFDVEDDEWVLPSRSEHNDSEQGSQKYH